MWIIVVLSLIIIICLCYYYKRKKPTSESTFTDTKDNSSEIVIQNATKNDTFYIEAFTTEIKASENEYIVPDMPGIKSNKKSIQIFPKSEIKPQEFIKISGIINKKIQLIIYYKETVIKNYTYSELYNIGKRNLENNLGLNVCILNNTGNLGMYNLGIKNT
jgi:hypothetical protein